MKKIIALVLSVLLLGGIALAVVADEYEPAPEGFRPSVSYKPAPIVVPIPDENDDLRDALIVEREEDDEGAVIVEGLEDDEDIYYTSIGEVLTDEEGLTDPETAEELKEGYKNLDEAEDLGDLAEDLQEKLDEAEYDIKTEDLVIRDLIDVSVTEKYEEELKAENKKLHFKLDLNVKDGDEIVAIISTDGGKTWRTLPFNQIVVNEDGTVSVELDEPAMIAFITIPEEYVPLAAAPENEEHYGMFWYVLSGLAAGIGITFLPVIRFGF